MKPEFQVYDERWRFPAGPAARLSEMTGRRSEPDQTTSENGSAVAPRLRRTADGVAIDPVAARATRAGRSQPAVGLAQPGDAFRIASEMYGETGS